ncbi:NAD-dependent epimerase/dehydratase family protein [Litorisediminicola beolgyonensis]|uniref:NAD-dependent epimerase/dehydratase family protein n=1 Tax=Litorisediminicola beolgyonensis TaxID=1173614 RepID=A0ABW3ZHT5_9RHOB
MGEMTVLITGAGGFIGRATVAEARRRGLAVRAVIRGSRPVDWERDPEITLVRADLSEPGAEVVLREAAVGVGAVLHCAAHLGADPRRHATDTVEATERLLAALDPDAPPRIVLVSTIAVYRTSALDPGADVTESTALDDGSAPRDAYVGAKLAQEQLCRSHATASGSELWLLRPGIVFGAARLWNAHLGIKAGPVLIGCGSGGELPLVHVDRVAEALVSAALTPTPEPGALNLLDDDRPDRERFLRALERQTGWPRLVLPLPFAIWQAVSGTLSPIESRLPGLLRGPALKARLMPLSYPNDQLRKRLKPRAQPRFEQLLARAVREGAA